MLRSGRSRNASAAASARTSSTAVIASPTPSLRTSHSARVPLLQMRAEAGPQAGRLAALGGVPPCCVGTTNASAWSYAFAMRHGRRARGNARTDRKGGEMEILVWILFGLVVGVVAK